MVFDNSVTSYFQERTFRWQTFAGTICRNKKRWLNNCFIFSQILFYSLKGFQSLLDDYLWLLQEYCKKSIAKKNIIFAQWRKVNKFCKWLPSFFKAGFSRRSSWVNTKPNSGLVMTLSMNGFLGLKFLQEFTNSPDNTRGLATLILFSILAASRQHLQFFQTLRSLPCFTMLKT